MTTYTVYQYLVWRARQWRMTHAYCRSHGCARPWPAATTWPWPTFAPESWKALLNYYEQGHSLAAFDIHTHSWENRFCSVGNWNYFWISRRNIASLHREDDFFGVFELVSLQERTTQGCRQVGLKHREDEFPFFEKKFRYRNVLHKGVDKSPETKSKLIYTRV